MMIERTATMHEVTFRACGPCACLIANGDASGDYFDPRGEDFRGEALDRFLADRFARMPVLACEPECQHPWTQQPCDVCGDYAEEAHPVVADYTGRVYPGGPDDPRTQV